MTDQEILCAAFAKAVKGGFKYSWFNENTELIWRNWPVGINGNIGQFIIATGNSWVPILAEALIFDHEFAKGLWGEKWIRVEIYDGAKTSKNPISDKAADTFVSVRHNQRAWRAHLQQMVLHENPIKYLEAFL